MRFLVSLVTLAALLGCDGGSSADRQRIEALVKRVDDLEQRPRTAEATTEAVDRLRNDVASLDRRMSATEAGLRELSTRTASPPPPARTTTTLVQPPGALAPPTRRPTWDGPLTREERTGRRQALRALSIELRGRLQELRIERGDDTTSAEHQQDMQELMQWYRERRRAILRGEPATE